MTKLRVLVTGAPGILGTDFTHKLLADGFEVETASNQPWPEAPTQHWQVDFMSFGESMECIKGFDAVLHLAGVNRDGVKTPAKTFEINAMTTFNVFYAAHLNGIKRLVWASTCQAGGGVWKDGYTPKHVPVRETDNHPSGEPYELSKLMGEQLTLNDRAWPNMSRCAIRYGYVYYQNEYEALPERQAHPEVWSQNLWNYIDGRDAYEITKRALTAEYTGGHIINATARDHIVDIPTKDLVSQYFPSATISDDIEQFGSLISMQAAKDLLGFKPKHSWRDI